MAPTGALMRCASSASNRIIDFPTAPKPTDRLRLIYLGDSVTFWPVDANYPQQVEHLLEQRTGCADVLFVHLGWNDFGQYGPEGLPYKRREKGDALSVPERIVSRSYAIRLVYQLQRMWRRTKPTVNEPLSARELALYKSYTSQHFYQNLRRIVRLGKARYPNVYLVTRASITSDDPTPDELVRSHFPAGMNKNLRQL